MKKITLLTLAVTMIAGLSLSAADDAAPAKPKRQKPTAEQMKKYDKNGDGKLDKEEKAAMNADKKKDAAPAK
jgi:Ni/Co efflux regulator RcnB